MVICSQQNKPLESCLKTQLVGFGWSNVLGFLIYFLLHNLGPSLPRGLAEFAMHEHYGDIYVFGGKAGPGDYQSAIYKLICLNINCTWSKINQSLKEATRNPIAIHVPPSLCT